MCSGFGILPGRNNVIPAPRHLRSTLPIPRRTSKRIAWKDKEKEVYSSVKRQTLKYPLRYSILPTVKEC